MPIWGKAEEGKCRKFHMRSLGRAEITKAGTVGPEVRKETGTQSFTWARVRLG